MAALDGSWRVSTRTGNSGACVEVRRRRYVQVRDSKDRQGPTLAFPPAAWTAFVSALADLPDLSYNS